MATFATPVEYEAWDYLIGTTTDSIITKRYDRMFKFSLLDENVHFSFKDPQSNHYTNWKLFYKLSHGELMSAYDVHRSVLYNEIIVESDFEKYEDNVEAARFIGRMLEEKGYLPMYYYSGNKSIHVHLLFDFKCLLNLDRCTQDKIMETFKFKKIFIRKFMEFIRERIITCWGTNARKFDENFIKGKHLIRSELSRNKQGYKTFLGYSYKDLSDVPSLCNEDNGIQPKLGELMFSRPDNIHGIMDEFMDVTEANAKKMSIRRKELSLMKWMYPGIEKEVKPCIKRLLEIEHLKDGFHRAMFVICNELKRTMKDEEVLIRLYDWNAKIGSPIRESEISYRAMREKYYSNGCRKIREVLNIAELEVDCNSCKMQNL